MNGIEGQLFITFIGLLMNMWVIAGVIIRKDVGMANIGMFLSMAIFIGYVIYRLSHS